MNNLDDNIKKLQRHLSVIKEKGVKNNINGKSKNSVSGKKFPNYSPVDETFICDVEKSNSQDVDDASSSSKEAFLEWSKTSPSKKKKILHCHDARAERCGHASGALLWRNNLRNT